jgi:molybdopterin/thiamine biosynthesis adenylyltransferase
MNFSEDQIHRYARHIILDEVGGVGQEKLLNARVLVVGAGGLGSPLLMYLAAAGVGTLGIVDDDHVSLSNLQRQIAHTTERVGDAKTNSAAETLGALNPDVRVIAHNMRVAQDNVAALIAGYDLVADGSDNFPTRFFLNDACHLGGKTLVSAAVLRFDGQLSTFKSYLGGAHPCYRCIYPAPPPEGLIPNCAEGGVLGALAGTMGTLQATEVIKEVLGIGESLSGTLMIYEGLATAFRKVRVKPDPACALCGTQPTIKTVAAHAT